MATPVPRIGHLNGVSSQPTQHIDSNAHLPNPSAIRGKLRRRRQRGVNRWWGMR